jgi:rhodanese-related sulfurtransferase
MKKYLNYFLILLIFPTLIISSCKKDDDDNNNPTQKGTYADLKNYMAGAGLDLTDVLVSDPAWVVPASAVVDTIDFTIPDWYVMDIRSNSDYLDGHIKGAVNVELKNVVTEAANAGGKKILIVCKTGQTAGHAVMALRLSGYPDAAVLKFGMAGWNPQFEGPWTSNIGNLADDHASEWSTSDSPSLESFANPSWEATATEGAEILAERVQLMLNNGFKSISSTDVFGHQSEFQTFNFWTTDDYTNFGHFSDAYQLKPISLANDVVKAVDSEGTTLVYCFTGQTSSMVVAWLNVLGYDAKSILFGVNKLKYDELEEAGKPHWHGPQNYGYESK